MVRGDRLEVMGQESRVEGRETSTNCASYADGADCYDCADELF